MSDCPILAFEYENDNYKILITNFKLSICSQKFSKENQELWKNLKDFRFIFALSLSHSLNFFISVISLCLHVFISFSL